MQLLSDQSTRKQPVWFLAVTGICLLARMYFVWSPPATPNEGAVVWTRTVLGLEQKTDTQKPLFFFLDNNNVQTARDASRLFSDPAIASLLNEKYSPKHIDTTDVVALGLLGPDLIKHKWQSGIIVYNKAGKPAAHVATFIPRRSLLQLLREVQAAQPATAP